MVVLTSLVAILPRESCDPSAGEGFIGTIVSGSEQTITSFYKMSFY